MLYRWRFGRLWLKIIACLQGSASAINSISISYNESMQPLVDVSIGGQWLKLVIDFSSGNTAVFVKEAKACFPENRNCYSFEDARARGTVVVCEENKKEDGECTTGEGDSYGCEPCWKSEGVPCNYSDVQSTADSLVIDGVLYNQRGIEAKDNVSLKLNGEALPLGKLPVRLFIKRMATPSTPSSELPLQLFDQTDGILGASGPTLSCRSKTIWNQMLIRNNWSSGLLILDFHAPPQAAQAKIESKPSRIVFDQIDPSFYGKLLWSQPKQTGDIVNDALYEFLAYHPTVCDVDLLYNTSSNWLTIIDTSGPCLVMPAFLFDRLRSRVKLDCPFAEDEDSNGRLCSAPADGTKLPNLYFQLEDTQATENPTLVLPLDRLIFNNGTNKVKGQDLLCVSRADSEAPYGTADMMFAHVAIGSLALAAFYVVANLDNKTLGLASRGSSSEGSNGLCIKSKTCVSPMQTYFPPGNICEDPLCSEYMFMRLDDNTKMCVWSGAVPVSFGLLLTALFVLDLLSHKLYKQAIEKASEFRP